MPRFLCYSAVLIIIVGLGWLSPGLTRSENSCAVQHPIMPPNVEFAGQCPNCGMLRSMWARTWKSFENSEGESEACSFHCLAEIAVKIGEDPEKVSVALYLETEKMVPQERAFFVVGSKANGTMTMTSKIAFAAKEEARKFAETCGGTVETFDRAFQLAKEDLPKDNLMIAKHRIQNGIVVEPADNNERCSICGMFPARYPQNRCQLTSTDKEICHFCSTQCLFTFLAAPASIVKKDVKPAVTWVTDYPSGSWIRARTAYYVVGSGVQGPMGHEAFAFDKKADAHNFANAEGGRVLKFQETDIGKIKPKE